MRPLPERNHHLTYSRVTARGGGGAFLDFFFSHKLVDQYGALYLHYVLLLLPVGSFFLMTNWWITCLHGWSGKSWIILLGIGGGGMGQVIRDPRITLGGGGGGALDPADQ